MKAVLDHVGIAVRELDAALAFYRDALGLEIEASEDVASQRVRAHFLPVGESKLELLEATAPDSAIAKYVEKRGSGLHHITLRVDDLASALDQLKARGARLIDEQPRPGAEGALVAFVHPSAAHGVLVELKQLKAGGPPTSTSGTRIQRFTVGDLELVSLLDGFMRLDGGALFGIVPRPVWSEVFTPDDKNRVRLAMRPLIVRGVRTMLIDAGIGDKAGETFSDRFGEVRDRSFDQLLAEAGLRPEDIDIVLATHLHLDHAGGFTIRDAGGRLRPRFPRARYVFRRGEWEDATHPHDRNQWAYVADDVLPLAEAGVLELVDEDQTIMPGVRVRRTGGHTMHHQIVSIESGSHRACYLGDLVPTAAHLAANWIPGIDLYPVETLSAKKAILKEAADAGTMLFFYHDPAIAARSIVDDHGRFRLQAS
jgi:methylmalonyl-CoA epimerase